jgi:leucyl/phenylalanyl-tRNA--protein transferase
MQGFTPKDLLACYARGVFPMADARDDNRVFLIDPERRGVIPLERFHVSRRLARTIRAEPYEVRIDTAFATVVDACAAAGPGRTETWINHPIERLYGRLHEMGFAHSVECWSGGKLVGGLYGVALKGAFFGESMFSRARDASKVALVHLVGRLIAGGFTLLDTQFMTEHLAQFGTEEITRAEYHRRLTRALAVEGDFQRLGTVGAAAGGVTGEAVGDTAGLGAGAAAAGASAGEAGFGAAGLGAAGLGAAAAGRGGAATVSGAELLQLISQAA